MVDDWSNVTVEEIKSSKAHAMAMGPFGSDIKSDNFVPFGVPIIRGVNLGAERFNDDDFVFLTEQKADELHGANAYPGDIIFTHRGTLGQVGIIPGNARYPRYVVSQSQMKLSCDTNKVDPLFVFYYFRSPFGQYALLANTSTTGVPAIARPLTTLKSIQLPLPPISEQHAIADFISSLDDKIELNHQMNETLEAMASAIFKSWFVDYDPVRAKMEGRGPYGMDTETAALFPSSFEDSALGKIPRGWSIKNLPETIEINPQRSLQKDQPAPYLEMSNMPTSSARALDWEYREFTSGMKFVNGDVLLARITPCLENGKTAFVDFLDEGQVGWGSTEYIVFSSKSPLPKEYAYFLARSNELRSHAIQNMTGTSGRQRVPAECFKAYPIIGL